MNKFSLPLKYAAAAMTIGLAGVAVAESVPPGDPVQVSGRVAHYALTPRGMVDGLILADGTEIRLPPHASNLVVFTAHPGDAVTVSGRKTSASPVVTAATVTNDATGAVADIGQAGPPRHLDDESRIKLQLHGPDGRLNGVLLEDGTIVRMPPPDAERVAASLAVGQPLYALGDGASGPLGKVIAAREIGPNRTDLTRIDESGFERWFHEVFGGGETSTPSVEPKS